MIMEPDHTWNLIMESDQELPKHGRGINIQYC